MITVYLYGNLRKSYGAKFTFFADTAAEAVRALCSQLVGFKKRLLKGQYQVKLDKEYLNNESLDKLHDDEHQTLRITPMVRGAGGKQGVTQLVIGAVLVAASWYAGGAAGWGYLGGTTLAGSVGMLGISLMVGGVAQLLTKVPKLDDKNDGVDKSRNSAFSNLDNVVGQGEVIPLIYGEIMVGSKVISQGIESYSIQSGGSTGIVRYPVAEHGVNGWINADKKDAKSLIDPKNKWNVIDAGGAFAVKVTKRIFKKLF